MLNLKRIKKTPQIIEELNEIKEKTSILTKELEARPVSNNVLQKVIIRTLNNRADYLHFTITNGVSKVFQHREQLMAGNFEFITKEIYPEEKIIIWAHILHIKRKSSANRLAAYSSFLKICLRELRMIALYWACTLTREKWGITEVVITQ